MVNFIVCELNPLHNGHAYLLQAAGNEPKVCIMSSHVTQRGEFAFCDKWKRTRMALQSGADLVLELSAPFAMGQAGKFAAGAMEIAKSTGLPGRVVFGCEGEVKEGLLALASVGEETLSPLLKKYLKSGLSYAGALAKAYEDCMPQYAHLISTPNNLLGLEYIKAAPEFEFLPVKRLSVGHDATETTDSFCSASFLRENIDKYKQYTPKSTHSIYKQILSDGLFPDAEKTDLLWLHALRQVDVSEWDSLAPDGVGRRLYKAVSTAKSVEEALLAAKSKCCTLSSLRRIALKAFIGDCDINAPQYIRVLGANKTGTDLLSNMRPTLPILTKPAAVNTLPKQAVRLMEYESRLTDTYMHLLKVGQPKGLEFLTSPIIL